jgi:hypothetical protein
VGSVTARVFGLRSLLHAGEQGFIKTDYNLDFPQVCARATAGCLTGVMGIKALEWIPPPRRYLPGLQGHSPIPTFYSWVKGFSDHVPNPNIDVSKLNHIMWPSYDGSDPCSKANIRVLDGHRSVSFNGLTFDRIAAADKIEIVRTSESADSALIEERDLEKIWKGFCAVAADSMNARPVFPQAPMDTTNRNRICHYICYANRAFPQQGLPQAASRGAIWS